MFREFRFCVQDLGIHGLWLRGLTELSCKFEQDQDKLI